MCYRIVEIYSGCRCLHYQHSMDMCAAYGQYGHDVQEKTVLVGYACGTHSNSYSTPTSTREELLAISRKQREFKETRSTNIVSQSSKNISVTPASNSQTTTTPSLVPDAKLPEEAAVIINPLAASVISSDESTNSIFSGNRSQSLFGALSADTSIYDKKSSMNPYSPSILNLSIGEQSRKPPQILPSLENPNANAPDGGDGDNADSKGLNTQQGSSIRPPTPEPLECSSSAHDMFLPPDSILHDFIARVRQPKAYLGRLQELETTVFEYSTAEIYFPSTEQGYDNTNKGPLVADYPHFNTTESAEVSDSEALVIIRRKDRKRGKELGAILESRNVLAKAVANIYRLQNAGYCSSYISILAADNTRENVIRLVPIPFTDLVFLLSRFEHCLRKVLFDEQPSKDVNAHPVTDLVDACIETLRLVLPISREEILEWQYVATIRLTAHLVDLAVLSYSGAHVNDFGKHCALETPRIFNLLNPFSATLYEADENRPTLDEYLSSEEVLFIQMQQYHLLCLDVFHDGQPVWVFSSPFWAPTARLLLSTALDPFADIWGPLWKAESSMEESVEKTSIYFKGTGSEHTNHKQSSYLHYVVGNGRIVKWPQSEYAPVLHHGEVFCHWISNREDIDSESLDWVGERPETAPFDGTEIMLIGAFTIGINNSSINSKCERSMSVARKRLLESGKLHIHGTAEPYLYKDSITYQLQIGYSGVNASTGIQYKKIPGRNLKGILVEQWAMFPEIRRPELLEDFYGLEVSMCTKNAKRAQLSELLSRNCMRNLLRSFPWPCEGYKEDYFRALETNCYLKLDSDLDFRTVFGKAVLLSLSFLKESGVNRENNLLVFLSSVATVKHELASLPLKEHSWAGLLRDSPDSCTMAMFGDHCLEFDYKTGSSCGKSGRSTLRTNLTPNSLHPPPFLELKILSPPHSDALAKNVKYWDYWWLGSREIIGNRMWLDKQGTLSVLERLNDETLLVDWRASPVTLGFKKLMRKAAPPHREFLEMDRSPVGERVRPLPVFVLAELQSQDQYV